MKKCFCHFKFVPFLRLSAVFLLVCSLALNVKLYLDNEILCDIVADELKTSKEEVHIILEDIHKANKESNATLKEVENAVN